MADDDKELAAEAKAANPPMGKLPIVLVGVIALNIVMMGVLAGVLFFVQIKLEKQKTLKDFVEGADNEIDAAKEGGQGAGGEKERITGPKGRDHQTGFTKNDREQDQIGP